jgi:hypothetical protein
MHNALDLRLGSGWAKTGLILRETTPPGARIAMFGAGNTAYFSHRYGIDMLGKMDPVIAHQEPHGYFLPGHNKWDFAHSVGRLRPSVMAQGLRFYASRSDLCALRAWGYREIAPQLLVRDDTVGAREAELGRRVTALNFYPRVGLPTSCP